MRLLAPLGRRDGMTRRAVSTGLLTIAAATPLTAQSLAQRVTSADGQVQVIYPSRASACGDGVSVIGGVLGEHRMRIGSDDGWHAGGAACVRGPARVLATVIDGEIARLRSFVGPVPSARTDIRTIQASAADAAVWLGDLLRRAPSRVASDAVLPLVVADAPDPWPLLIRLARDGDRPRAVRNSIVLWLSMGVTEHLGLTHSGDEETDDDEMRAQAVFVLSQRPESESVPALIDLARGARHASARRAAIFWLGQSGDPRAVDVYAELLGLR